ncbi:hypothetical protein KPL37_13380 [Clostridium frigoris]|uniref:DUF2680 domain-containing protein n=1 Tax=Clostridium frigoris TaxID=205327 RepID=A0ABS6BWC2_9CLOT|nr:hypothetical protein [Clostridium frigoris]MBU3160735.1 hypothetical protein [Clostridium frigoris]
MKSKKLWVALTLSLVLVTSGVVFAAEISTTTPVTTVAHNAVGMARASGVRGYDYVTSVLKTKGFTDTQITAGLAFGKTVYELAKEKGATLKKNIKTNTASCIGNFGEGNKNSNGTVNVHGTNKAHGNGDGMMGSGKRVSK